MYWPLSLQRIKRKTKIFMGKRLVCHWKELSAVNLITTLLLSLHLSLSRSCSVSNSFLLSQSQSRRRERACVRGISATHIIINVEYFTSKKYFPPPVCMLDPAIHKVRQTLSRTPSLSKCFLIGCMLEKISTNKCSQTFEMGWQAGELFVHH